MREVAVSLAVVLRWTDADVMAQSVNIQGG